MLTNHFRQLARISHSDGELRFARKVRWTTDFDWSRPGARVYRPRHPRISTSYGARVADLHRECGVSVGRVLKGESSSDLPIMLPKHFELVVNFQTARAPPIAH
jgi:hypothetical protein